MSKKELSNQGKMEYSTGSVIQDDDNAKIKNGESPVTHLEQQLYVGIPSSHDGDGDAGQTENETKKVKNQEIGSYHDPNFDSALEETLEEDSFLALDDNDDDESSDKNGMPLYHYARLYGSLPRQHQQQQHQASFSNHSTNVFTNDCTCSVMGKTIITAETSNIWSDVNASAAPMSNEGGQISSHSRHGSSLQAAASSEDDINPLNILDGAEQTGLWLNETIHLAGLGFSDGNILLMDARNGLSAIAKTSKIGVDSKKSSFLRVRDNNNNNSSTNNQPNASTNNSVPIAAVSFDSSGTSFGAIDEGGMCCIWTMKYKVQMRKVISTGTTVTSEASDGFSNADPNPPSTIDQNSLLIGNEAPSLPGNQQQGGNSFASFVSSRFNWQSPKSQQSNAPQSETSQAIPSQTEHLHQQSTVNIVPALTVSECKINRVNYPRSFGKPTCLALDPAYSLKRETSLLVAFDDGRIVLSKRGWLLQRREDKFIQYNGPAASKDFKGIEAMLWRGSLVAFADCSGVRLYDIETLKPIAHIDRPTGARPSLYPSIAIMKPCLCFETSHSLLVAWGDCLLTMKIRETAISVVTNTASDVVTNDTNGDHGGNALETAANGMNSSSLASSASSTLPGPSSATVSRVVQKKRVVECSMAWALDCVACGVAPMDENHVVVLGLPMPSSEDDDHDRDDDISNNRTETSSVGEKPKSSHKDELELQVISRSNGNVIYYDLIPMLTPEQSPQSLKKSSVSQGVASGGLFQRLSPRSAADAENIDQQQRHHYERQRRNFFLLSSFALPRMENSLELTEESKVLDSLSGIDSTDDPRIQYDENFYNNRNSRDEGDAEIPLYSAKRVFRDCHAKWNLRMVTFDEENEKPKVNHVLLKTALEIPENDEDASSVDSDDYGFVYRDVHSSKIKGFVSRPPLMMIISNHDAILARTRDIDDVIAYKIDEQNKAATGLRLGIQHIQSIRRFTIDELVHRYFRSLLCVELGTDPKTTNNCLDSDVNDKKLLITGQRSKLSLRRVKLASEAMPVLFGGKLRMWEFWLNELEKIPGALFIIQEHIPVRDPTLPPHVYSRVLTKMLDHVDAMKAKPMADVRDIARILIEEAESRFLAALLCWGTYQSLFEHIKLYKHQARQDANFSTHERMLKDGLIRRETQSAAKYLDFPLRKCTSTENSDVDVSVSLQHASESLYSIELMMENVASRTSLLPGYQKDSAVVCPLPEALQDSRLVIDAAAKLCLMKGNYDDALRLFLEIGNRHSVMTVSELEEQALATICNEVVLHRSLAKKNQASYSYLLHFVEQHNLYQNLLIKPFAPDSLVNYPILSLMRLIGLDLVGKFLIRSTSLPASSTSSKLGNERRGTLPVDLVADQLSLSPKLLLWYLHSIFISKPEIYVKFPNTANPPPEIINLHKTHLDLAIKYAGKNRDSAKVLEGVESYRVFEMSTPLLLLLKEILQVGSIGPAEVGKMLQKERRGGSGVSTIFALEVAYIMEHFGENTEDDANLILELYLHGSKSVMLAASFAQRNSLHSEVLWEKLVDHCLTNVKQLHSDVAGISSKLIDGSAYGSLLEAAALSGADLAHLISQIPTGMQVEGLKPRLVAAVADYRLKVQMHSNSSRIASKEHLLLLREETQRARRAMRYEIANQTSFKSRGLYTNQSFTKSFASQSIGVILPQSLRTVENKNRALSNFSLPIR